MNIFIHHRDLRYIDNTSLIEQTKNEKEVTPKRDVCRGLD